MDLNVYLKIESRANGFYFTYLFPSLVTYLKVQSKERNLVINNIEE